MRTVVGLGVAALVAVTALPASAASLSLKAPARVAVDSTLEVTGTASFSGLVAPALLFEDATGDDEVLAEATPPAQDLIGGNVAINRPAKTLDLTWNVVDLPDEPGGVPEVIRYMWDFSMTRPGYDPALFQVQAKFTNLVDRDGPQTTSPAGNLEANCATDAANVITCEQVGDVDVSIDAIANSITAHIPWALLRDNAGTNLMVPGTVVAEADIFEGIVATAQAVFSSDAWGDDADAPPVVVGKAIQLGIVPAGAVDDATAASFMTTVARPDASDRFSAAIDLTGFPPGSYEVVARPCRDAACGDVVRAALEITA